MDFGLSCSLYGWKVKKETLNFHVEANNFASKGLEFLWEADPMFLFEFDFVTLISPYLKLQAMKLNQIKVQS